MGKRIDYQALDEYEAMLDEEHARWMMEQEWQEAEKEQHERI